MTDRQPKEVFHAGLRRSHLSYFKRVRSARIDSSVAETNKLLIRLNKLLIDLPSDPVKRKGKKNYIYYFC